MQDACKLERRQRRLAKQHAQAVEQDKMAFAYEDARQNGRTVDPWVLFTKSLGEVYPPGMEGHTPRRFTEQAGKARFQDSEQAFHGMRIPVMMQGMRDPRQGMESHAALHPVPGQPSAGFAGNFMRVDEM